MGTNIWNELHASLIQGDESCPRRLFRTRYHLKLDSESKILQPNLDLTKLEKMNRNMLELEKSERTNLSCDYL